MLLGEDVYSFPGFVLFQMFFCQSVFCLFVGCVLFLFVSLFFGLHCTSASQSRGFLQFQ